MKTRDIIWGVFAAFILAISLSPFASQHPDGLERVAEDQGFIGRETTGEGAGAPMADYHIPGVKNEKMATALAGAAGVIIVFVVGYGAARMLQKRKDQ
jgi:hypothetical protein